MSRLLLPLLAVMAILSGCAGPAKVDQNFSEALSVPYTLDSGDRLRIHVFGQSDIPTTYSVNDSGYISVPLIGDVGARGLTTSQLEAEIAGRLRNGFLRNPSVSVQVETYRPFFILGEVHLPGKYPFVSGLTANTAVAIAGGFTPRAVRDTVTISRPYNGTVVEARVPVDTPVRPGDTVTVIERWF